MVYAVQPEPRWGTYNRTRQAKSALHNHTTREVMRVVATPRPTALPYFLEGTPGLSKCLLTKGGWGTGVLSRSGENHDALCYR